MARATRAKRPRAVLDPEDPVVKADKNWSDRGWEAGTYFRAALSVVKVEELISDHNAIGFDPYQLTTTRHEALAVLFFSRDGEMPLGKLGQHLMVHPTSITSTVDTLERLGYVQRVAHPTDRRQTLARITEAGRTAMEQASRRVAADAFGLAAPSEDEVETLFDLLAKVRRAAHGNVAPSDA
ncbi:MAG: MarR family transcriptional regulator [Ilumatobacteraceae bacterium]